MACQKVVCQECATTWEGIHYCAICLRSLRQKTKTRSSTLGWLAVVTVSLGLLYVTSLVMVWSASFVAGWF